MPPGARPFQADLKTVLPRASRPSRTLRLSPYPGSQLGVHMPGLDGRKWPRGTSNLLIPRSGHIVQTCRGLCAGPTFQSRPHVAGVVRYGSSRRVEWRRSPPIKNFPVTARTVQGMARVPSGQAPAWPLSSDRSVRRGSGIKRDFACTFSRHFPPVLVVLRLQSCLRLEGRARTLSGPSPGLTPTGTLALSACMPTALISSVSTTRLRKISLEWYFFFQRGAVHMTGISKSIPRVLLRSVGARAAQEILILPNKASGLIPLIYGRRAVYGNLVINLVINIEKIRVRDVGERNAIRLIPAEAWQIAIDQRGEVRERRSRSAGGRAGRPADRGG